jgi:hypothetical protein
MKRFCPLILLILGAGLGATQIAVAQEAPEDPPEPFHRTELSCAEMRQHPAEVFAEDIDLGSGAGWTVEVEYDCPEGLGNLPFLRRLAHLADAVRGAQDQDCDGTILLTKQRSFAFSLLKAGFAPALFLREAEKTQAQAGPEHGGDDLYSNQLRYFAVWSEQSFSNFQLHRAFLAESDRALPLLAAHYQEKFHISPAKARTLARHGLMIYLKWAAGTFSEDELAPPPPLVQLSLDRRSTVAGLRKALVASPAPGPAEIDRALKVALLHNRPRPYLALLVQQLKTLDAGDESALFFALGNLENVKFLLARGASVDYANRFGKTPLFYAVGRGDLRLAKLLLDHGAGVDHNYKKAAELEPSSDPLLCGEYHFIRHAGRTPLMHAAQHADVAMLKLLLARGARREDVDGMGFNALDYARMGHRPANAAVLAALGLHPHEETSTVSEP